MVEYLPQDVRKVTPEEMLPYLPSEFKIFRPKETAEGFVDFYDSNDRLVMQQFTEPSLANVKSTHYRYFFGRLSFIRQEGPESSSQFAGLHKDDGCLFTFSNPVSTYVTIDTTGMSNNSVV